MCVLLRMKLFVVKMLTYLQTKENISVFDEYGLECQTTTASLYGH